MKKRLLFPFMAVAAMTLLPSCLDDETVDYDDWRLQNEAYVADIDTDEYTLVVPDWAPMNSVYIKWHNDRKLTESNLVPMSNSTVSMTYELYDINGNALGNSFANTDSVYQSRPNQNIVGMWIAMTTMHVGDTATLIIPYPSAYGTTSTGSIKPYSTLVYGVKIKSVDAYEKTFQ